MSIVNRSRCAALADAPLPSSPLSFVCCIEHGRLEAQTLTMVRSLRQFGGALASAPVIAVIGRTGARLRPDTLRELADLEVELVHAKHHNPAPWFNYANKIVAVQIADELATTEQVAWLDSDILVADDLSGLVLAPQESFAARAEWLPPAVFENDPSSAEHLPYWRQLCELLGTRVEALPWLQLGHNERRVLGYFNSGVLVWRRGCGFAPAYREAFCTLLQSRLAQKGNVFFTADQVILAPVIIRQGLPWRHLERQHHHMIFQGFIDGPNPSPPMCDAAIIHYSRSMSWPHRPRFIARLTRERPVLAAFLREEESRTQLPAPRLVDVAMATALRWLRGAQWRRYAARVTQDLNA